MPVIRTHVSFNVDISATESCLTARDAGSTNTSASTCCRQCLPWRSAITGSSFGGLPSTPPSSKPPFRVSLEGGFSIGTSSRSPRLCRFSIKTRVHPKQMRTKPCFNPYCLVRASRTWDPSQSKGSISYSEWRFPRILGSRFPLAVTSPRTPLLSSTIQRVGRPAFTFGAKLGSRSVVTPTSSTFGSATPPFDSITPFTFGQPRAPMVFGSDSSQRHALVPSQNTYTLSTPRRGTDTTRSIYAGTSSLRFVTSYFRSPRENRSLGVSAAGFPTGMMSRSRHIFKMRTRFNQK